jgi:hypothetical protein
MVSVERVLDGRKKRVLLRTLVSITGTVLSMRMCWGHVTQLYTRHLFALINSYWSLNYWADLTEGAINELLFWQGLPRARFVGPIWPPTEGVSIRLASDASDFGWGGHTLEGVIQYAHEYHTEEQAGTSSTYEELIGVLRCLRALMHLCEGKFVVFQVDAENLLGIVNRGSAKLHINVVVRELLWLCVERDITLSVEWVPRELHSIVN